MTDSAPASDSSTRYNLRRRFAVLSFICVGALTLALWLTVSSYLTNETLEREWETTAKFVRKESRRWINSADFKTLDFHSVAPKFQKLHEEITMMPGIARIKVYNTRGAILWSDEQRLIGAAFANNPELTEALAGEVVADLSSMSKIENIYEQNSFQGLVEVYVPVFSENEKEVVGVIETYRLAEPLLRDIRRARLVVLYVALIGGAMLYLSLFAIVNRASRKIDEQQKNLLQMQSELSASQRMAALGEMAAAVAHGIGNPISSIRAAAQLAKLECAEQSGCTNNQTNQVNLQNIIGEVDRVEKRIRGLLNFVRPLEPRPSAVNLNLLLHDVVRGLGSRFAEARITPCLQLDAELPKLSADPVHLEQVFLGLLTNAVEATPPGGSVNVSTAWMRAWDDSRDVQVVIEDTGESIPPENQERIFEPFFTTKPHGTGIGLALARKFVERNGGTIKISQGQMGGARFEITFPANEENRG